MSASSPATGLPDRPDAIQVWDLPLRLCHWGLAAAVIVAWLSAGVDGVIHGWSGLAVAAFTLFRLAWGLIGSHYSRFSDLAYSPRTVLRHVRDVGAFRARRYIGHDPSGGAQALVMFGLLGAICVSGYAMPADPGAELGWLRDVHKWSANLLLALIPFHILAVMIKAWLNRESLTRAMITGWKRIGPEDELPAEVRDPSARLLDRLRAFEALLLWGLLGLAATLYWQQTYGPRMVAVLSETQRAPVPAAPPPQKSAAVPAEELARLVDELKEAKQQALREIATGREEAQRELQARLKSARDDAAREIEQRVREARQQALEDFSRAAAKTAEAQPKAQPEQKADDALGRRLRDAIAATSEGSSTRAVLSHGGRLYDNWYAVLGKSPPAGPHPAWPPGSPAASPADTWRCAACHGYDYRGALPAATAKTGANGNSSSVRNAERMALERIITALGDNNHRFSDDILPQAAKIHLALFLSRGQYTAARYYDANGHAKGNAARGKELYLQSCASCHGLDGRAQIKPERTSLGAIASASPAEMFHKVRNGHVGASAAGLRAYSLASQVDVLAYIQSLPK